MSSSLYYDRTTLRPTDTPDWSDEGLRVARTSVGAATVSTVFLVLDYRFGGDGPPLLFETLVFGGLFDQEGDRYATEAEARAGHAAMVQRVREAGESA